SRHSQQRGDCPASRDRSLPRARRFLWRRALEGAGLVRLTLVAGGFHRALRRASPETIRLGVGAGDAAYGRMTIMGIAVGIDLGTTNSVVAAVRGGVVST